MKTSKELRAIARQALNGSLGLAVIVSLLASLLGGIGTNSFSFSISDLELFESLKDFASFSYDNDFIDAFMAFVSGALIVIMFFAVIFSIAHFIIGCIVGVGYAKFNLDLVDNKKTGIGKLFAYFKIWKTTVLSNLLQAIFIFLWSLLFFLPGIFAAYSYSMTNYILAENPTLSAPKAIRQSKRMMHGNRFELFFLHLSFIGWDILACMTFGIGYIWLTPYKQAATAAFYREISGSGSVNETVQASVTE